jgi:DNA polymerase-3 subunit delta
MALLDVVSGPAPTEKTVKAGYLFFGGDLYEADQFLGRLKAGLTGDDGQAASEERFDPAVTCWRDVFDAARAMPFFFSPWRIMVVALSKADQADLTDDEAAVLKEFFADPTPRTVLFVLCPGPLKSKPLYKLFAALPKERAAVEEMEPLKGRPLFEWVEREATRLGARMSTDAIDGLMDMVGSDQRALGSELEKLFVYVGERKKIEAADVQALSDGERDVPVFELTDALEQGDLSRALGLLDRLMPEGANGGPTLGLLAGFLRDLLLARIGLRQGRERREIFREIRPNIKEHYGFYAEKLRAFFGVAEALTDETMARLAGDLERLDVRLKSTDSDAKALFEAFICDFGRAVRRPGPTSRPRG